MTFVGMDRRSGRERRTAALTEAQQLLLQDMTVSPRDPRAHVGGRVDTHGELRGVRAEDGSLVRMVAPALMLGIGLGAMMDSVVFHHLLQWHHVTSGPHVAGVTALDTGPSDLVADGIVEAAAAVLVVLGLVTLWNAASRHPHRLWGRAGASFTGWLVTGWALYNVLAVSLPQFVLDRHHINVVGDGMLGWDLVFLGVSLAVGAIGLGLAMQGRPRDVTHDDWVG